MSTLATRFEQTVGVGHVLTGTMPLSCPDIESFTTKGIAQNLWLLWRDVFFSILPT